MAKLTSKTIQNVLNEFKTSLFIAPALEKCKVNHYDFFEYINNNDDIKLEYEKISNYNNIILEDKVAEQCYTSDANPKILLEMIKANNKKKYNIKQEVEVNTTFSALSDDELDSFISKYLNNN